MARGPNLGQSPLSIGQDLDLGLDQDQVLTGEDAISDVGGIRPLRRRLIRTVVVRLRERRGNTPGKGLLTWRCRSKCLPNLLG